MTLKADTSEQMTLEVHFLALESTVEKRLDTSKKHSVEEEAEINILLAKVQQSINRLARADVSDAKIQKELDRVKDESKNSSEKKAVLQHLKEVLRKIESLDESTAWQDNRELLFAAIRQTRPSLSLEEIKRYDKIRSQMAGEPLKGQSPRIGFK